ncbi:MAG TPA: gamma-glutamyltransferase family protein [Usitatibacter sp.]|nr:gamma-glutamyltransferase family protein [Usitatibacter sp.]
MSQPIRGTRGMAVAPHALAAQSALAVMREGGNAIEAMVAAAATIAVVYPHMNSIGGDAFWLVHVPGEPPRAIDACGAAAHGASIASYRERGLSSIPFRGGVAANTVAGTVSGWELALSLSAAQLGGRMPLTRLLADAIHYAREGIAVTRSQTATTQAKLEGLRGQPGFDETYLVAGAAPITGTRFRNARLAATLDRLAQAGLADFYRGDLARSIAGDLAAVGSPVALEDLERHRAMWREPLQLRHSLGTLYNMPPPTQGVVSLLILGILDALQVGRVDPHGAEYVHLCVEAVKQAFGIRDRHVTDPAYMKVDAQSFLAPESIASLAARIDRARAAPWGAGKGPADTVWMGAIDERGCAVSFIQSLYHEYGSGVVLAESGINWQNRGCSFSLDEGALNALAPGRKPFHTLNPALALLSDRRAMVYGNMGGDGQPQTQSAVFTRTMVFGMNPADAIAAPRWLLGRTWGQTSDTLKLESRFPPAVIEALARMGHEVEVVGAYDEVVGHAGAVIRHPNGLFEGGSDPRSDGAVASY